MGKIFDSECDLSLAAVKIPICRLQNTVINCNEQISAVDRRAVLVLSASKKIYGRNMCQGTQTIPEKRRVILDFGSLVIIDHRPQEAVLFYAIL